MSEVIILMGKPNAGKGTRLEKFLKGREGYRAVSTGDFLRNEVSKGTELGMKAKGYMDSGKLVPDEIINSIISNFMSQSDDTLIFDGYPRTVAQVESMLSAGIIPEKVVCLDVDDEIIIERAADRLYCPECKATYTEKSQFAQPKVAGVCDKCNSKLIKREDDKPEVTKKRLDEYFSKTEPVKDALTNAGIPVLILDGNNPSVDELFEKAMEL